MYRLYITTITGGAPWAKLPSKGTVKRKTIDMMVVYKKDVGSSSKISNWPMLGFWDSEKVGGHFQWNVSPINHSRHMTARYLSDYDWQRNFVWYPLFVVVWKKMGLDKGSLIPYEDIYLQAFNRTTTRPWGYVKMIVYVGEERDLWSINT